MYCLLEFIRCSCGEREETPERAAYNREAGSSLYYEPCDLPSDTASSREGGGGGDPFNRDLKR